MSYNNTANSNKSKSISPTKLRSNTQTQYYKPVYNNKSHGYNNSMPSSYEKRYGVNKYDAPKSDHPSTAYAGCFADLVGYPSCVKKVAVSKSSSTGY